MIHRGVMFTVTDDSHNPTMVGVHYRDLRTYVRNSGLKRLYKLRRGPGAATGPAGTTVEPVELDDTVWTHPSWLPPKSA